MIDRLRLDGLAWLNQTQVKKLNIYLKCNHTLNNTCVLTMYKFKHIPQQSMNIL